MMEEHLLQILALLFLAGLVAGWVDALAGGGGLIALPALLLAGLPPAAALATNKLQGSFGTITSSLFFIRKGIVSIKENYLSITFTAIGSVLGGVALLQINPDILALVTPILLIAIALYFLLSPTKNLDQTRKPKISKTTFDTTLAPIIAFYDGFFGPGTGTFFSTSFLSLRGLNIRKATAHAKMLNCVSNLSVLVYFLVFGEIVFIAGFAMIGGQIIGAYLGAKTALNIGGKIIKPVIITVCIAISSQLLWQQING